MPLHPKHQEVTKEGEAGYPLAFTPRLTLLVAPASTLRQGWRTIFFRDELRCGRRRDCKAKPLYTSRQRSSSHLAGQRAQKEQNSNPREDRRFPTHSRGCRVPLPREIASRHCPRAGNLPHAPKRSRPRAERSTAPEFQAATPAARSIRSPARLPPEQHTLRKTDGHGRGWLRSEESEPADACFAWSLWA